MRIIQRNFQSISLSNTTQLSYSFIIKKSYRKILGTLKIWVRLMAISFSVSWLKTRVNFSTFMIPLKNGNREMKKKIWHSFMWVIKRQANSIEYFLRLSLRKNITNFLMLDYNSKEILKMSLFIYIGRKMILWEKWKGFLIGGTPCNGFIITQIIMF